MLDGEPAWDAFAAGPVAGAHAELVFAWVQGPGESGGDGLLLAGVDLCQEGLEARGFGVEMDSERAGLVRRLKNVVGLVEGGPLL